MSAYDQTSIPDAKTIRRYILNIQEAEADVSGFIEKKQRNYETRHALWPGQSPDGRKRQAPGDARGATPPRMPMCERALRNDPRRRFRHKSRCPDSADFGDRWGTQKLSGPLEGGKEKEKKL